VRESEREREREKRPLSQPSSHASPFHYSLYSPSIDHSGSYTHVFEGLNDEITCTTCITTALASLPPREPTTATTALSRCVLGRILNTNLINVDCACMYWWNPCLGACESASQRLQSPAVLSPPIPTSYTPLRTRSVLSLSQPRSNLAPLMYLRCFSHKGHLFCKQCIFQNLLEQKKLNKKKLKKWQEANLVELERLSQEQRAAEQAKVEAFVKREESITSGVGASDHSHHHHHHHRQHQHPSTSSSTSSSSLESESHDGNKKKKAQSWWLPSEAPDASSSSSLSTKPSKEAHCPRDGHSLKLKDLVAVDFKCESKHTHHQMRRATDEEDIDREAKSATLPGSSDYICHVCSKDLKAISKVVLIRTCGHAICYKCSEQFVKKRCPVCEKLCDEPGEVITLQPPASSFSAGGATVASKSSPAPRMM